MRKAFTCLALTFALAGPLAAQSAGERPATEPGRRDFPALARVSPLAPAALPPELLPTRAHEGAALPAAALLRSPGQGARWGALIGGAAMGGFMLLLVAADAEVTGDEAVHIVGIALTGALLGAVVGMMVGSVAGA